MASLQDLLAPSWDDLTDVLFKDVDGCEADEEIDAEEWEEIERSYNDEQRR